jgi:hypothetical protein
MKSRVCWDEDIGCSTPLINLNRKATTAQAGMIRDAFAESTLWAAPAAILAGQYQAITSLY